MITSVTTVTTMLLDVSKWCIYRMYRNGWCHLVPVVTEGGIDLVVDCGALAVEIPSSTAGMRARHYARRCAGNHRCLMIGAENQSSTSTRWRVESKRAANAISSPCHVQRTANIRRTRPAIAGGGDYKYARNVVRLAIEGYAREDAGEAAELAERPGFGPKKTGGVGAYPQTTTTGVYFEVVAVFRGLLSQIHRVVSCHRECVA